METFYYLAPWRGSSPETKQGRAGPDGGELWEQRGEGCSLLRTCIFTLKNLSLVPGGGPEHQGCGAKRQKCYGRYMAKTFGLQTPS